MTRFFRYSLLIFSAVLCIILNGCTPTPPDIASVEEHFLDNYDDIEIVIDFMRNTGYDSIYINGIDGTMLADLERITITDEKTRAAVKRLLDGTETRGRQYHSVSMRSNTIELHQWSGSMDIGCGIAYSINKTDIPNIQYCTELVPLSDAGWYYYVDDYNAWRAGKRPSI